jgi:hypothetical protein
MRNNIISKVLKFVGIGVIIVGIAASLISGGSVNTFSYEKMCKSHFLQRITTYTHKNDKLRFFNLSFLFLVMVI